MRGDGGKDDFVTDNEGNVTRAVRRARDRGGGSKELARLARSISERRRPQDSEYCAEAGGVS